MASRYIDGGAFSNHFTFNKGPRSIDLSLGSHLHVRCILMHDQHHRASVSRIENEGILLVGADTIVFFT